MILHTAVPMSVVMDGIDEPHHRYTEIQVDGILMQVEPINAYQVKIVRLFSPNPYHYLNPSYAPGQIIQFKPVP